MYYEINVSKKDSKNTYKHYFATAKRSITYEEELIPMVKHFSIVFPKPEYCISITYYSESGVILDVDKLLNKNTSDSPNESTV